MSSITPPVCKGCLYPPDPDRKLYMFESVNDMFKFIDKKNNIDCPESYTYPEDIRGFLLECPNWKCSRGYEVDSIESLIRTFNWQPTTIDAELEEYERQVKLAQIKSNLDQIHMLLEIFSSSSDKT